MSIAVPRPIPIRICGAAANSASTTASLGRSRTSRIDLEIASITPTSPSTSPAGTYTNGVGDDHARERG